MSMLPGSPNCPSDGPRASAPVSRVPGEAACEVATEVANEVASEALCQSLADALRARHWRLVTAESCTGGLIAAACTALAGSSDWFDRGVVTYSNEAKVALLGVDAALIAREGAVSVAVARAMAEGAARTAACPVSLSVTGIAGPSGATPGKPVGTVCFGWSVAGRLGAERRHFDGDRRAVREAAVRHALAGLLARLG